MEIITSLQNDKVKLANGLQQRARTRRKERKIVLEGTRLVRDAVQQGHRPFFVLYQAENIDPDLLALLEKKRFDLLPVNAEVLKHVSDTQNPAGVVAVFPLPLPPLPKSPKRVLILDALSDPGNMGTMLRTAAAAGVDVVLLSPNSVDPYNPKALRSGMGAHFRVPVIEANWEQIADFCEKLQVYVTSSYGDLPYDQVDWTQPHALIIGSEAHGVGEAAEELAHHSVYIPMSAETESLNAALAAGVVLFEAARQIRTQP